MLKPWSQYHPKIRNPGVGKPKGDTKPLLHACTVLTYTAWEVYVEDLLIEATPILQQDKSKLPKGMKDLITERVSGRPWDLAGESWKHQVEGGQGSLNW